VQQASAAPQQSPQPTSITLQPSSVVLQQSSDSQQTSTVLQLQQSHHDVSERSLVKMNSQELDQEAVKCDEQLSQRSRKYSGDILNLKLKYEEDVKKLTTEYERSQLEIKKKKKLITVLRTPSDPELLPQYEPHQFHNVPTLYPPLQPFQQSPMQPFQFFNTNHSQKYVLPSIQHHGFPFTQ